MSRRTAVLALVLLFALLGPAAAQETGEPPAAEPPTNSWSLAPSGTNPDEPGTRPNLSYEIGPGATVDDSVTLWNFGNTELTFRLYATDAFNNSSGAFDLLTGEKTPTDAGSWVTLATNEVTAPPDTKTDIPFRLVVPPDALPGDHTAAILASSLVEGRNSDGRIVGFDRRVGSRLYLRVAGTLQPALTVDDVHAAYHSALNPLGGSMDVTYTVRNTGNVRLGAHLKLRLENLFGRRMEEKASPDITELLPGNAVTVRVRFEGVTAALRVTATPMVKPFPVGEPESSEIPEVTRAVPVWAVPWSVLALVLVAGLIVQLRRQYRMRSASPPPPDSPGGAGPAELAQVP